MINTVQFNCFLNLFSIYILINTFCSFSSACFKEKLNGQNFLTTVKIHSNFSVVEEADIHWILC